MVIDHRTAPSVFDADALNILSIQRDWLSQVPPGSILTPHPKEFDRLFGEHRDDFARIGTALSQSAALQCVIVLKGHHTLVAADGEGHFNTTGNPGLAKGGSGDVLTGIITGLLGQGYEPRSAAVLGVYIHGLASDIAVQDQSYESLIASDLNMCLGKAFKMLSNVS
jgi:NAD(P)H-hydrate epimerase